MYFLSPFLRFFFKLLYHQFAWTYDWVAWTVSVGLWKDWVLAVLPFVEGPSVLELGHGPGHLQSRLLENGFRALGLDVSPQMGRLARRRLRRRGQTASLILGRAQSLPLASGSCDQVVATFPTEYINDSDTLKEIWRVLRAGGQLVVLPAAWITGQRWMERYAAALFKITRQAPALPGYPGSPQASPYPLEFPLVDSLGQAGFQVHVEWKELRSSTLILILGKKPADE